jgi:TonB family protein
MTRRHDSTLATGLCTSLVLHGALVFAGCVYYISQLESRLQYLPAITPPPLATTDGLLPANEFQLGEAMGVGSAIMAAEAHEDALARRAENDQPFASLDPAGFGKVGEPPVADALPAGQEGGNPPRFGVAPEPAITPPRPRAVQRPPVPQPPAPVDEPNQPDGPQPIPAIAPVPEPTAAIATTPDEPMATPAAPSGAPAVSADPAPQADGEIDPFSKTYSAEFRTGRTRVQIGRKHKLTRPRVLLAGQMDLIGRANARVVLAIRTDASGKVTTVAIEKSSGSQNVDQPALVAAYDWWFEPPKDAAGRPLPDGFLFTLSFVD